MVMVEESLTALRKNIFEAYIKKTSKSKHMYERACQSLEGGTPSSTRFFPPYPLYMTRGKGSKGLGESRQHTGFSCRKGSGPEGLANHD